MSKPQKGDSKKISISGIEDALREAEQSVERIRTDSERDLPVLTAEEAEAMAAAEAAGEETDGGLGEVLEFDDDASPSEDSNDEIFELDEEAEAADDAPPDRAKQIEDRLIRMAADFDNYKKRVARDQERIQARAAEALVKTLLPVMDNLERALQHAEADPASLAEGVAMVHRQFAEVFASHAIQCFAEPGETFDPNVHEAMAQRPSEAHPRGAIDEVYQKGYRLNDQLIRPALVIVAGPDKGESTPAADSSGDDATAEEDGEERAD